MLPLRGVRGRCSSKRGGVSCGAAASAAAAKPHSVHVLLDLLCYAESTPSAAAWSMDVSTNEGVLKLLRVMARAGQQYLPDPSEPCVTNCIGTPPNHRLAMMAAALRHVLPNETHVCACCWPALLAVSCCARVRACPPRRCPWEALGERLAQRGQRRRLAAAAAAAAWAQQRARGAHVLQQGACCRWGHRTRHVQLTTI